MFIGRINEINEISAAIDSASFEAILLTGRRRVGKTEILKKIIEKYKDDVISFECKNSSLIDNLNNLSKKIASFYNLPNYSPIFNNFDNLFDFVFQKSINRKKALVLIIDEFSFLLQEDMGVASSLAIAIDKYKNMTNIKIVLSGSLVGIMRDIIDGKAPLYGRFTHIINVHPFNYFEASQFYPNYSDEDKILMYSVFGGVAFFNSLINPKETALSNIKELIIKKDSILEHEVNEIILSETNKIADLNTTIELIGTGVVKYTDLKSRLSLEKRPDYLLKRLQEIEIISKVSPINDLNNNKKTFYRLKDNLVHFYYRYVYRYLAERNNMSINDFYHQFVEEDLNKYYLPLKFEEITTEYLIRLNKTGKIKPPFSLIGTYIFNDKKLGNRQFDVVTKDKQGFISYECKYTKEKVKLNTIKEEISQSKNAKIKFYRLGFVSKSGFSSDIDLNEYICYQLKDFYK